MSCQIDSRITIVEYDGDEHYRHSLKIKIDRAKDEIARKQGYRVVRFPYWIQLDAVTMKHYFGLEAQIAQSFPHGFIITKLFPASFCEVGIELFRAELRTSFPRAHGDERSIKVLLEQEGDISGDQVGRQPVRTVRNEEHGRNTLQ